MDIAHPLSPLGHGGIAHTLPRLNSSKASPLPELDHGDFLAIDDLLDFSNEDIGGPIEPCLSNATSSLATAPSELKLGSCVSSPMDKKPSQQTPSVFDSDELCVPCDDLAELEWLSNFVEESFSSGDTHASLAFGANGGFGKEEKAHRGSINEPFQSTSPVSVLESSAHSREKLGSALSFSPEISVPGRARSKRCRTAVCFWNTRILSAEASESILESSSTTSTITAASSDSDIFTAYYDHADDDDERHLHHHHQHKRADSASPKVKKFCKLYDSFSNSKPKRIKVQDGVPVRKCLHCATQKTPQWRAGPMGPKTLCNACGVRYKSGRLCPEYRPAASPTFVENFHSNSHRRVLEMRKQRGELISSDHHSHEKRQNQLHCRGNGDHSGGDHSGSDNSLSADE